MTNLCKLNVSLGYIDILMNENGQVIRYRFFNHPDNPRHQTRRDPKTVDEYNNAAGQEYKTSCRLQTLEDFFETYDSSQFMLLYNYCCDKNNFKKVRTWNDWFYDNGMSLLTAITTTITCVGAWAVVIASSRN
eukprot:scaffold6042_cov247-Ochromonas_danica.AAC.27